MWTAKGVGIDVAEGQGGEQHERERRYVARNQSEYNRSARPCPWNTLSIKGKAELLADHWHGQRFLTELMEVLGLCLVPCLDLRVGPQLSGIPCP